MYVFTVLGGCRELFWKGNQVARLVCVTCSLNLQCFRV